MTRLVVAGVAILAVLWAGPEETVNEVRFGAPRLTEPLGGFGDVVASPLARWDAVWYLSIADAGYGEAAGPEPAAGAKPRPEDAGRPGPAAAFFPLYPLLVWLAGGLGSSEGAALVAAYAVSLLSLLGALYLLHRLVTLELGPRVARAAVLLVGFFPASLYFGAPYSESLFLLLSVGAFYAARTGRWAWAGALAAGASATRSAGILLLVPLALLYLYGPRGDRPAAGAVGGRRGVRDRLRPRHRIRPDALWLGLAPAGLVVYTAYLGLAHGDAFAYLHLQEAWYREFAGPFGGIVDGAGAALDGLRQLASGERFPVYFEASGDDPFRAAGQNLMLFGFLLAAAVAVAGTFRRLPAAYGAYAVVALALPLSFPVGPQPLMSLPRFLAVLFPLFMWLALACEERRLTSVALAVSAAGLAFFTAQFATWHWVA